MTLDAAEKSSKTALRHQTIWCVLLFCATASWLYQSYFTEAVALFSATAIYLALSVANYKIKNKLVWLCIIPAAGTIVIAALPLANLWYYLFTSITEKPMNINLIGALGIMLLNSFLGIVAPSLVCWALLIVRRNAL
nr:hypothetical protein [Pseudomonas benzenivorans]